MLASVHSIVHFVDDVEKVAAWYGDLLKTSPAVYREGFVEFELAGGRLCFHARDPKAGQVSGTQVAYWSTDDMEEFISRFESRGGSIFRHPITVEQGMRVCQLRDPFGCVIGLAQRAK